MILAKAITVEIFSNKIKSFADHRLLILSLNANEVIEGKKLTACNLFTIWSSSDKFSVLNHASKS